MRVLPSETGAVCRAFQETFTDNIVEIPESGPCIQRAYRMAWGFYLDHGFGTLKKEIDDRKFFVRFGPEVREETYVPLAEWMDPHTKFTECFILFRLAFPVKEGNP